MLDPIVVALEPDPVFAARIAAAARVAGAQVVIVEEVSALWAAIERWPALVIVDLAAAGWEEPIRRAKMLPHTRRIPIVAFGNHVTADTLQAARQAGCDHAWSGSRFAAEGPDLLQQTLHPPTRWVEGWDAAPPAGLCCGIAQFNVGEYWECHETLESLWNGEPRAVRDLYQGLLQVGVAFHHLRGGNYPGALKMLRRGLPRLRDLPETCQGVRAAELYTAARGVHDQLVVLGPERLGEFDLRSLPRIVVVGCQAN